MIVASDAVQFPLGRFHAVVIQDATARYPLGMLVTNPPSAPELAALGYPGGPSGEIETSCNCVFIDTGPEQILIDTGLGATGHLRQTLRAHGIEERSIDVVILSHAHPEHISGVFGEDGQPVFRNARHVMFKAEWDYWSSDPSLAELQVTDAMKDWIRTAARKALTAIRRRVDLLEKDTEIIPGVSILAAPGHTAGHAAVEISSGGERLLYMGDAVILPMNLPYPEAIAVIDHQPEVMLATRRRLLDRAATSGSRVVAPQFPFPGMGHVRRDGNSWVWHPLPGNRS